MKILHVVGARPNFPKLAPVYRAAQERGIDQVVVHTGQHYDDSMSADFFRDLGIPHPDENLSVGSGSHAAQTARIIERFEPVLMRHQPDWLVVYGDVNSTVATALVAAKLGVRIAHVEAGLRSYDRSMPEEINRIVTDRLANLLLTPSPDANAALLAEGAAPDSIVFVGNVMIDTLNASLPRAVELGFARQKNADGRHVVVTLHRPSNVDDPVRLRQICSELSRLAEDRMVFFPAHPRTQQRLAAERISLGKVQVGNPLAYLEVLDLVRCAHAVVTDSGGLQEETTALGVPCFTLRPNTERPITIIEGTNKLVQDLSTLQSEVESAARVSPPKPPKGWDGNAGARVADALRSKLR